jgi:PadR family transcriptional regulator PadR
MAAKSTNPNFMNGVPELLILRLLKDREMYGYELVQAIRTSTRDEIALGEGVVYPVLHGLEKDGALKSRKKPVGGRTRVYYSITAAGQKRLGTLISTWSKLNDAVANALDGGALHTSVRTVAPA